MRRLTRWLRTDEREDAVRSLQWAVHIAKSLEKQTHSWKWMLVALHNTAQGFMVLALSKGNGLLALRPKIAAKWLTAYAAHGPKSPRPFPAEKLDDFLNLYAKVKDPVHFSVPFPATARHDQGLERLNKFRNDFIHFTPKGWSIELAGLPNIVIDTSDLISWCANDAGSFVWYKMGHAKQTASAVRRLRRVMKMLNEKYSG